MRNIVFLFLLILTFFSCSKSDIASEDMAVSAIKLPPKLEHASYDSANMKDNQVEPASPAIPQKIIKEATLRFETNDLEETFNKIQKAIKESGATVQNDAEGKDYNSVFRNITVRIPSRNFDSFIQDISKGVSYFERKEISSQNVTEQYIDLNSRLNTKRKLENRYLQILQKATKISEILEIEKQLSAIREEIEAKEGQLKYLESRVSESTIYIEFYKTIAEKESVKTSYGSKIINAIKTGFYEISGFFISLISVWPFILLFLVIAYFIRKRFKRKKT
jgi:hypothetical protein